MSNTELLTTMRMQSAVAASDIEQLTTAIANNHGVLPHEAVPALDVIVGRLQQAHATAVALQQRAHGTPEPRHG